MLSSAHCLGWDFLPQSPRVRSYNEKERQWSQQKVELELQQLRGPGSPLHFREQERRGEQGRGQGKVLCWATCDLPSPVTL